ncbi:hypothetical protein TIFTF001_012835 [Ficus carica]|uniref:Uncharacterized protein n=1 Tax=Ficus carica TaxID=3494 RepID=A0AA88AD12_FICCA|nr:hypothetical protein TIFTF001_012835 [Ficus carica]
MKKDPDRRYQSKYYTFHRDIWHLTFECKDLKNEIEDPIRRGYLTEYTKDSRKGQRDCDSITSEGMMQLPITVRTRPFMITTMSSFLVNKGKSPYNTMIGRSTLRALKVVTSIYQQTMKFPIVKGTGQVKGNQYGSKTTYMDVIVHDYAEAQLPKTLRPKYRMVLTKPLDTDLDCHLNDDKLGTGPVKDLIEIQVDS